MFALVDCDNCFVSCERIFRPDLEGKPVVVLSNNDGCVVARSSEAKQLGIKEGVPYFQLAKLFPGIHIEALSSNYTLYGDISARIMSILRQSAPKIEIYSIDEAFCDLTGMEHSHDLKLWGEELASKIKQWVGMPVSIGIAPTRTLAKVASRYAKQHIGYKKCCVIDTEEKRRKALSGIPTNKIWGVGHNIDAKFKFHGCSTAIDFADKPQSWVRMTFPIPVLRTWKELNGESAISTDEICSKKSICTSRSFQHTTTDYDIIRTNISNYAARCAEKLRKQHSVCNILTLFLTTDWFKKSSEWYSAGFNINMHTPSNSTIDLVSAASLALERIYKKDLEYKRAGVIVSGITSDYAVQTDLFYTNLDRKLRLDKISKITDNINNRLGSDTIVLASQQYPIDTATGKVLHFRNAILHTKRTPCYTTTLCDIITVK